MNALKSMFFLPTLFVISFLIPAVNTARAQGTTGDRTAILMSHEEVMWADASKSLPPGTKIAILEGDPNRKGPLTMRLRIPAGAAIAPHTHPGDERFTVLSGSLHFGLGEAVDQSAKLYRPGSFFVIPAGDAMFAFTADEETVLQLNVEGPWSIKYLHTVD